MPTWIDPLLTLIEDGVDPTSRHSAERRACPSWSICSLRDTFSIEVESGEDLEAKGNIVEHEYKIECGGDKVAEVSKHWFRMRDTYGIEIAESQDEALMLAIAVCIDQMAHNVA